MIPEAPLVWRPKGPFGLIDRVHDLQSELARLVGRPSAGMRTDVTVAGRQVLFIHNPKTGGKSLREVLGVRSLSHAFPSDRLSERNWLAHYTVTAVRHPFDRFLSGYFDHVLKPNENALVRRYGRAFKTISAFQYLDILLEHPKFGGSQLNWAQYPSRVKPNADLILRYEEIANWPAQLVAAGIEIGDRRMQHRNASRRAGADLREALRLTEPQIDMLRARVRAAFAADYNALNYD